jgi:hypothetical protein
LDGATKADSPTDCRQFSLQRAAHFGTVNDVRTIVVSLVLLAGISATSGQEQEGKLIDRLLKPNLALANSAQNKQFAAKGASFDKRVQTRTFCISERSPTKSFGHTRVLSPKEFASRRFRTGDSIANLATRSQPNNSDTVHLALAAYDARVAPESGSKVATNRFADNRPFLAQGRSQKALSARDTPLTIEQVRELLNKNK